MLPTLMGERYPGGELEVFAKARRWKAYLRAQLVPYLVGDILEVGAGIGGTTLALCDGTQSTWLCLEPDTTMAARLAAALAGGVLPKCCRTRAGTVTGLPAGARFDAILYIDVLEHIAEHAAELAQAAGHLRAGGVLIVVGPAHPWLYSPFDAAIGHHRRYTTESLTRVAPGVLRPIVLRYLDSVGLLASAANRFLLRNSAPGACSIRVWDGWLVPLSRRLDPWLGFRVGKSVLGVWRAPCAAGLSHPASPGGQSVSNMVSDALSSTRGSVGACPGGQPCSLRKLGTSEAAFRLWRRAISPPPHAAAAAWHSMGDSHMA